LKSPLSSSGPRLPRLPFLLPVDLFKSSGFRAIELDRLNVEVRPPRLNRFLGVVDSLLGEDDLRFVDGRGLRGVGGLQVTETRSHSTGDSSLSSKVAIVDNRTRRILLNDELVLSS
jgi:hypothetical protein